MRAYGLIEGRGMVRVSGIGEKIAQHRDHEEYKEAIINAIRNIPLWNNFYRTFTERGEEPWEARTAMMLSTYCGLTPDKATEIAPEVIKQYNEDVKAIRNGIVVTVNEPIMTTEQTQQNSERLVDYGFGKYRVYLPDNEEEAKAVWSRLKKMVDSIFGEKA
jgi:hypothetical protein